LTTPAARRVHGELVALDSEAINRAFEQVKWRRAESDPVNDDDEDDDE
jgi:hypothetical protein